MTTYLKVYLVLIYAFLLLILNKSDALVVAPIVAVGLIKVTLFFAGLISAPVVALVRYLHKRFTLKTFILSVIVTVILSLVFYFVMHVIVY